MFASEHCNSDIVQNLTDAGAEVNAVNKYGETALMLANEFGNSDVVLVLIAAGADVNAKDNEGKNNEIREWRLKIRKSLGLFGSN